MRLAPPALVRPLEEDWKGTLDAVARTHRWPGSGEVARLAPLLEKLSASYNDVGRAPEGQDSLLAPRLAFSFPRDVPKAAGAVRELVATGALTLGSAGALKVLDLGAGLGASTWGVVRALEAGGALGSVDVTWVDPDPEALEVAQSILRARPPGVVRVHARAVSADARRVDLRGGRFDLILLGQVLSEVDRELSHELRIERHSDWMRTLLHTHLDDHGSLVIVEPALRERTRHLHAVRDRLAAGDGVTVFAPCLHAEACPALAHPGDWCHEDLPVDLPTWVAPLARAAGLRWQGLTFSYLVLRRDGVTLASSMPALGDRVRVVSDALVSKGKREAFICGLLAAKEGTPSGRVRAMRLNREESDANVVWEDVRRGDCLTIEPSLDPARPRIGEATVVRRVEPGAPQLDRERTD